MLKAINEPREIWASLIMRHFETVYTIGYPSWKEIPLISALYSRIAFKCPSSDLVKGFWNAWNKYRECIEWKGFVHRRPCHSIFFLVSFPKGQIKKIDFPRAKRISDKGCSKWGDFWMALEKEVDE